MEKGEGEGERMRHAFAAAILVLAAAPAETNASAWTRSPGEALLIATAFYDRATNRYPVRGAGRRDADFSKIAGEIYAEYGLAPGLTAIAHGGYGTQRDGAGAERLRQTGASDFETALRLRLYDRPGTVFSVQQMIGAAGEASGGGDLPLLARGRLYETRALFGRSFEIGGAPTFINLEAGHRWRDGPAPNEWRADIAFGVKPGRDWEFFAQSFSTITAGGAKTPFQSFRSHKVQLSALKRLNENLGVQAGLFRTVRGRNVIIETGAILSLWVTTDALAGFLPGL